MKENEIIYQIKITFQDILDNSPQYVRDFYGKLNGEEREKFIKDNLHSSSKGVEFGLSEPVYDVISTIGQNLESNKEIVLVELIEPSVNEKGRTVNGSITMIMTLGGYEVSYVNENGTCELKEFYNQEDAEAFLNELKEKYPECV